MYAVDREVEKRRAVIEFRHDKDDPSPVLLLHALRGVCDALNLETNEKMCAATFTRVAGLALAADILSQALIRRIV